MKRTLWTEWLEFGRVKVTNTLSVLHGCAPPKLTVYASFFLSKSWHPLNTPSSANLSDYGPLKPEWNGTCRASPAVSASNSRLSSFGGTRATFDPKTVSEQWGYHLHPSTTGPPPCTTFGHVVWLVSKKEPHGSSCATQQVWTPPFSVAGQKGWQGVVAWGPQDKGPKRT